MPSLKQRHLQPEIMDQPGLDSGQHERALRGLARINFLSRSAGILWPSIHALAQIRKPHPLKILDLACGAGDVPIRLWLTAQRHQVSLDILGYDLSPVAVEHARQRAQKAGAAVQFAVRDVLNDPLEADFDVVTSSLFLHHLNEDQAVKVLSRMAGAARNLVLVNDLVRSAFGWWMAWVGTRLLTRSSVVHTDGPRSVEGAFSYAEARALALQAGMEGVTVEGRWPARYLLTWRRTS